MPIFVPLSPRLKQIVAGAPCAQGHAMGMGHHWHEIRHWQWPLWRCQRCQMQTKQKDVADTLPCHPARKGQCRVCHADGMTPKSMYCERHRLKALSRIAQANVSGATRRQADAARLRDQGLPYRVIGEQLGVSTERARQLADRAHRHERDSAVTR